MNRNTLNKAVSFIMITIGVAILIVMITVILGCDTVEDWQTGIPEEDGLYWIRNLRDPGLIKIEGDVFYIPGDWKRFSKYAFLNEDTHYIGPLEKP